MFKNKSNENQSKFKLNTVKASQLQGVTLWTTYIKIYKSTALPLI